MFIGLHYLRAVAAIMVTAFHTFELQEIHGVHSGWPHYILASGVDLFFVLSGFLMVYTTRQFTDSRLDIRSFMQKRLLRIAPIYWLLTLAIGSLILLKPGLSDRPIDSAVVLRSLLFLPSDFGNSTVQTTVIPVGWTLVYEMSFYVAFGVLTSINYRLGIGAVIILITLLAASHSFSDGFYHLHYSNPIIIEFVLGMLAALLPRMGRQRVQILLLAFGCLALLSGAWIDGRNMPMRWFYCGTGATAIVYALVNMKLPNNRLLYFLGSASFSIYLVHMYGIKYLGFKLLGNDAWFGILFFGVLAGIIFYIAVERPLDRLIRRIMDSQSKRQPHKVTVEKPHPRNI